MDVAGVCSRFNLRWPITGPKYEWESALILPEATRVFLTNAGDALRALRQHHLTAPMLATVSADWEHWIFWGAMVRQHPVDVMSLVDEIWPLRLDMLRLTVPRDGGWRSYPNISELRLLRSGSIWLRNPPADELKVLEESQSGAANRLLIRLRTSQKTLPRVSGDAKADILIALGHELHAYKCHEAKAYAVPKRKTADDSNEAAPNAPKRARPDAPAALQEDRPHVEELNAIDDLVRLRHGSRLHTSCLHVDEALERPMCSPVSLLRKFMPPDDGLAVRIGELCESLPNIKHGPKIVAESPQVTYHSDCILPDRDPVHEIINRRTVMWTGRQTVPEEAKIEATDRKGATIVTIDPSDANMTRFEMALLETTGMRPRPGRLHYGAKDAPSLTEHKTLLDNGVDLHIFHQRPGDMMVLSNCAFHTFYKEANTVTVATNTLTGLDLVRSLRSLDKIKLAVTEMRVSASSPDNHIVVKDLKAGNIYWSTRSKWLPRLWHAAVLTLDPLAVVLPLVARAMKKDNIKPCGLLLQELRERMSAAVSLDEAEFKLRPSLAAAGAAAAAAAAPSSAPRATPVGKWTMMLNAVVEGSSANIHDSWIELDQLEARAADIVKALKLLPKGKGLKEEDLVLPSANGLTKLKETVMAPWCKGELENAKKAYQERLENKSLHGAVPIACNLEDDSLAFMCGGGYLRYCYNEQNQPGVFAWTAKWAQPKTPAPTRAAHGIMCHHETWGITSLNILLGYYKS